MTRPKKQKPQLASKGKQPDPGSDGFVMNALNELSEDLSGMDRDFMRRFDEHWGIDEEETEIPAEKMAAGVSEAREALILCGRACSTAFDDHWCRGMHAVLNQIVARKTGDPDLAICSGKQLLENAARLALLCDHLDQLHETFSGDLMGEIPAPEEAAKKLAAVTCFIQSLGYPDNLLPTGMATTQPDLLKECLPMLKNRFSDSLGDLGAGYEWLSNDAKLKPGCFKDPANEAAWFETLNRAIAGGALATGALFRDLLIYFGMLRDMVENCSYPWVEYGDVYQWIQPSPTGDGKTEETAFQFHHARNKFEAVGMAHEFLGSYLDGSHRWCIASVDDKELTEYADTSKGKIWFRYRMDPQVLSPEMLEMLDEE